LADNTAKLIRLTNGTPDGRYLGVNLILKVNDPDSSPLLNMDQDPEVEAACTTGVDCTGQTLNTGVLDFRYGRVNLANSYGSELENILVQMKVEYWDAVSSAFTLNDLDTTCTAYSATNLTPTPDYGKSGADGNFTAGQYAPGAGLYLNAPNINTSIGVVFTVDDFLKFDWDNDNVDDNPSSTIQFGRYRGNDRVIYWREQ